MNQSAFHRLISFGLFLMLACASVSAQSTVDSFAVQIPFDFIVGEQTLPAGAYTIQRLRDTPAVLVIQSTDRQRQAVIWTTLLEGPRTPGKMQLVFRDYGAQRFLAQVWSRGDKNGRLLVKSRAERELAKSASAQTNTISLPDARRQK